MRFEPVIGLEIHVQLKTETKMFCSCSNRGENEPPNTTICPVCLGHPGVLPTINRKAVEYGILIGRALGCEVADHSKFDRKNYFYPDLPKGYQISQFDLPIVSNGVFEFNVIDPPGSEPRKVRVRILRVHLEEDAAKLRHATDGKASLVDFNRGGTPLAEIVTEPDFRSPAEAKAFLQELRLLLRYLGVSDADMEKGHLRCDANISLRKIVEDPEDEAWASQLNPKTELKNINTFKAVEKALEYEIKRQTKLWLDDKPPSGQSTRGWDDVRMITVEQRSKEGSSDYRYFPEPDLPPMMLHEIGDHLASHLPELPEGRRRRFMEQYGFSAAEAKTFCDDKELSEYAEQVMSELDEWISSAGKGAEPLSPERKAKLVSGWLLTKLKGVMTEHKISFSEVKMTPENFAELLTLLHLGKLTGTNALLVLNEMALSGADPSIIMEEKNLSQLEDMGELEDEIRKIVSENPKAVEDWKNGKDNAIQFLVGQVMKATRGKAPPDKAREIIEKTLKNI